jgi:hypothetical protein
MSSHSDDSNASIDQPNEHLLLPHWVTFTSMESYHGYRCHTGCMDRTSVKAGSILQFSPSCLADITQNDMVEELVVVLRLSTSSSSIMTDDHDLYHCAVVRNVLLSALFHGLTFTDNQLTITRARSISSNPSCARSPYLISPWPRIPKFIRRSRASIFWLSHVQSESHAVFATSKHQKDFCKVPPRPSGPEEVDHGSNKP